MSRSGYWYLDSCDLENWEFVRWRGQVTSATRGKRGQALLRDMLAALDAMPQKRLIAEDLQDDNGEVCALGAAGLLRGLEMRFLDPEDYEAVAKAFDVADCLVREITYVNDEDGVCDTPERRWERVRNWVARQLKEGPATSGAATR